jgi:hypothetical protein
MAFLEALLDASVDVHRGVDAHMACALLRRCRMNDELQKQGGEVVPEVMQAELRKAGALGRPGHRVRNAGRQARQACQAPTDVIFRAVADGVFENGKRLGYEFALARCWHAS